MKYYIEDYKEEAIDISFFVILWQLIKTTEISYQWHSKGWIFSPEKESDKKVKLKISITLIKNKMMER